MKLIVIVLCLIAERFLIHKLAMNRFGWFKGYSQKIDKLCESYKWLQNPYIQFVFSALPIILIVYLVGYFLDDLLLGLPALLFDVFVLYYCLGPDHVFYPNALTEKESNESETVVAEQHLVNVNQQLFAPLFWFLVCGPVGVVTYRIISLYKQSESLGDTASMVVDYLDWIPARMLAFLYILAGNFKKGLQATLPNLLSWPEQNAYLLTQSGHAAADEDENGIVTMGKSESLVDSTVILFLVLLALLTLASFL